MTARRGLVLAISASLIVGCAIGLIAGVLFARSLLFPHPSPGHDFGGPPQHRLIMGFLARRLDLTKEQTDRIQAIIEDTRASSDSLREGAHRQILEVLTPEQRARWERMSDHMFPRHDEPPGGDEPPPRGGP